VTIFWDKRFIQTSLRCLTGGECPGSRFQIPF
jgi:hypothetical protein